MSDKRLDEILDLILNDLAKQNIGPGESTPFASVMERALSHKIRNMDEFVNALNRGIEIEYFTHYEGGPKGLGYIVLTNAGYDISRSLHAGYGRAIEKKDQLAECPFCHLSVTGVECREDGLLINDPERKHPGRYKAFSVICDNCGARGPIVKVSAQGSPMDKHEAVERAFELWNQRAKHIGVIG